MFKAWKSNIIQANAVIYKTFFVRILFESWDFNLRNKEAIHVKANEIYQRILVSLKGRRTEVQSLKKEKNFAECLCMSQPFIL
jgi:hypothetical protein